MDQFWLNFVKFAPLFNVFRCSTVRQCDSVTGMDLKFKTESCSIFHNEWPPPFDRARDLTPKVQEIARYGWILEAAEQDY